MNCTEEQWILQINYTEEEYNMQQTNIIGDTWKDRSIDYNLIDRINKQYEREAKIDELKGKLAKKKGTQKEKKENGKEELNPVTDIKYIKTPDELRDIKGSYSLQKGVYVIDFDINVPNGCGLILEPGVKLEFAKDAGITCEGRFEAKGEEGIEVLLTAKNIRYGWKNLYLKGRAEAILDYAGFSYGRGRKDNHKFIIGGAVFLKAENNLKPSLKINNSCFKHNSAKWGGVIYNNQGEILINENNMFENNFAIYQGGVICNRNGNVIIKKNNILRQNSTEYGGAIYNRVGEIKIEEYNIFRNNSAKENGGAIYNFEGDMWVKENNIFENNYTNEKGGAIRNFNGRLNIDRFKNIFKGNKPDDISKK